MRSRQPAGTASGGETASPARGSVKRKQSVVARAGIPCNRAVAHLTQAIVTISENLATGMQTAHLTIFSRSMLVQAKRLHLDMVLNMLPA